MRLIIGVLLAWPLAAQVTAGSISGYVFDPSRGPVEGAAITALDEARSLTRTTRTDSAGFYRFVELPAAVYRVSASAERFETVRTGGVRVAVGSPTRLDFNLPLARLHQTVEVSAPIAAVETESSDLATVIGESRIQSLPLNRRDFLQLALLSPGVLPPVQDSELATRGGFAMHANGAREESNNFLLDGVDNNDPYTNRYLLQPSVDTVQEFKVATNSYTAEYGRSGGGQVNVITRSGENDWHGFAYEYLRNRALDAGNYFDGGYRPQFIRNQFGAGTGGAVVRNKLFFFANFDGLRERRGLSRLGSVPGAAERQGDLSGLGATVFDPFTRQPFAKNQVPATRISSKAAGVLALFPLPNLAGQTGNYLAQPVLRESQSQYNGRVDYRAAERDQLTLRYTYGGLDLFEPYAEDSTDIPGFGDSVNDSVMQAMVHHLHVLGPRAVNSLRLAFARGGRDLLPQNHATDVGSLWGVSWLPGQARDFGYPLTNVAGYSAVGDATGLPIIRHTNSYQIAEGLSLARGNQAFKLGGEVREAQLNGVLQMFTRGMLSFSGALSGSGISDLLLGFPSFGIQSQADNPQTLRTTTYALYLQDDWKVRPAFTLNLGLRYEYNTPATDPGNRMSALDLSSGTVLQVGTHGLSRSGIRPDRNNLAPRVGFAWSPGGGWVLRGGYGLYYDAGMFMVNSSQYFNPPYFTMRMFFPSMTSLLTLNNPFPTNGGFTPPASLNTLSSDITTAYLQDWNLNVQRRLGSAGTLSVAYAGSKGTHLVRSRDLNQPLPGPGDVQENRPMPQFGGIFFIETGANSAFHSLQALFDRPLARGLSFWAAYTVSKSIDDTSAFLGTKADSNFPQNSRNYRAERGLSSFDMPQRVAVAYVYQLPWRNAVTRHMETRGIFTAQSGQPFTPMLRFDNSNTGNGGAQFGSDRPDVLRSPALDSPGPLAWFDTTAFRVAPQYSFGNAGRNILRGPGLACFDVSLVRSFLFRDRTRLSAEVQAFNLFNRTNFDLPENYADEPGFGRIFSAKAPRQIQFALRLRW